MFTPEQLLEGYGENIQVRETSYLGLLPGDLITFEYSDRSIRFGLVVKSRRTGSGMFISSKNNLLLNVMLLDAISQDSFSIMINILYKDRSRCSYVKSPALLTVLFGKNSFRTFNVARIRNIRSIIV